MHARVTTIQLQPAMDDRLESFFIDRLESFFMDSVLPTAKQQE